MAATDPWCCARSSAAADTDEDEEVDDEDEDGDGVEVEVEVEVEVDANMDDGDCGGVSHFFSRFTRRARAAERKDRDDERAADAGEFACPAVGVVVAVAVAVAVLGCFGASLGDDECD